MLQKELGVEPASVLRGTGFAPDDLSSFGMKSSVAQFVKGAENAIRLVDDSSLPFRVRTTDAFVCLWRLRLHLAE